MNITKDTKLSELLKEYPWLIDEVVKISDKAKVLKTPVGKMMIKKATIADVSSKTGLSTEEIIAKITEMIKEHS